MKVRVKTKSGMNEIVYDESKDLYIVKLKSIPEKGKANIELVNLLSKYFKRRVKIVRGLTSRDKILEYVD